LTGELVIHRLLIKGKMIMMSYWHGAEYRKEGEWGKIGVFTDSRDGTDLGKDHFACMGL
jgi:hypothetical protein